MKNIYDEVSISSIQNWVDNVRDCYKRVLAIDEKYLNFKIIKIRLLIDA